MTPAAITYADLLGKPFVYGGRGPERYDCYGLVVEVYRRSGLQLPDYASTDDPTRQGELFADGASRYFRRVEDPQALDIALFRLHRGHWHCGVIVDDYGRFAHITEHTSVSCEDMTDPTWAPRLAGIYRFRGMAP